MVLLEQFSRNIQHLSAPLYFHFGHYNWFLDTATSFSELVDTNVIYFLFFLFLTFVVFYKNTFLKNFLKNFFKMPLSHSFNTLVLFYYNFFFTNFKKIHSYFTKIYSYFTKKKK